MAIDLRPQIVDDDRASMTSAILRMTEARVGLGAALVVLAIIIFGWSLAPYDPTEPLTGTPATGPTADHLLGTDTLGRDVLSRVLTGGRSVFVLPMLAVSLALVVGGGFGLLSAYRGGRSDRIVARGFDILLTLPPMLVVLVFIAAIGPTPTVIVVTTAIVFAPGFGRVVRGATQAVVVHLFIASARARGERTASILIREILPNIAGPVLAEYGLRLTYGVLFIGSLSFLGLGVQPPSPDWGLMVAENRSLLASNPLAALAPAMLLATLSVSYNLMADALSAYLSADESARIERV
jgi:peptide/nickel transport system permease protein